MKAVAAHMEFGRCLASISDRRADAKAQTSRAIAMFTDYELRIKAMPDHPRNGEGLEDIRALVRLLETGTVLIDDLASRYGCAPRAKDRRRARRAPTPGANGPADPIAEAPTGSNGVSAPPLDARSAPGGSTT